ncbi:hypothetical protein OIO90_001142 [Microbotryomycetes sp. JL221]|nr:hypothetical protein OIO90_001142 [Microbotryomycetes sp. JL221]
MTSAFDAQHGTNATHHDPDQSSNARMQLESTLEMLLQSLLEIGICASDVQPSALETADDGVASGFPGGLIGRKVSQTLDHLAELYANKDAVADVNIPLDVISYVDQGKNPHAYTREMIERVSGENMYTNGILSADYRDILTTQMTEAFPELAPLVKERQQSSQQAINGDNGRSHDMAGQEVKMEH